MGPGICSFLLSGLSRKVLALISVLGNEDLVINSKFPLPLPGPVPLDVALGVQPDLEGFPWPLMA